MARETIRLNDVEEKIIMQLARDYDATTYRVIKRLMSLGIDALKSGVPLFGIQANDEVSGADMSHIEGDLSWLINHNRKQIGVSVETLFVVRQIAEHLSPGLSKKAKEEGQIAFNKLVENR